MQSDPGAPPGPQAADGQISDAITNVVVRLHRDFLGRGPSEARTTITGDTIVVVLRETLTRAERSLTEAGRQEDVLRMRRTFQRTMGPDLVRAVEEITGRRVLAFMSDNHLDPDLACEVILLTPESAAGPKARAIEG